MIVLFGFIRLAAMFVAFFGGAWGSPIALAIAIPLHALGTYLVERARAQDAAHAADPSLLAAARQPLFVRAVAFALLKCALLAVAGFLLAQLAAAPPARP